MAQQQIGFPVPGAKQEEKKKAKRRSAIAKKDCAALSEFITCKDLTDKQKMVVAVMLHPDTADLTEKKKAATAGVCQRTWRYAKHDPYIAQWVAFMTPHSLMLRMPDLIRRLLDDFDKTSTDIKERNLTFRTLAAYLKEFSSGLNPFGGDTPGDPTKPLELTPGQTTVDYSDKDEEEKKRLTAEWVSFYSQD